MTLINIDDSYVYHIKWQHTKWQCSLYIPLYIGTMIGTKFYCVSYIGRMGIKTVLRCVLDVLAATYFFFSICDFNNNRNLHGHYGAGMCVCVCIEGVYM